jgi:[ribosomal protein S5]-alanine N-acetyltransferase
MIGGAAAAWYNSAVVLHTERLTLREFTAADAPAVLAYQSDPRYLRFYEWTARSPEDVQRFVRVFTDWQAEVPRTRWQLAIVLPGSGQLIGNCGVRRKPGPALVAELGYELDPEWWGRGLATEAARAMVAFGFADLGLQRISAECLVDNTASARVLERLGLRQVRRLPGHRQFKGRLWDGLEYSLTAEEWRARERDRGTGRLAAAPPPL